MYKKTPTPFSFALIHKCVGILRAQHSLYGEFVIMKHETLTPKVPNYISSPQHRVFSGGEGLLLKAGTSPDLRWAWTHEPRLGAHSNVLYLPKQKRGQA